MLQKQIKELIRICNKSIIGVKTRIQDLNIISNLLGALKSIKICQNYRTIEQDQEGAITQQIYLGNFSQNIIILSTIIYLINIQSELYKFKTMNRKRNYFDMIKQKPTFQRFQIDVSIQNNNKIMKIEKIEKPEVPKKYMIHQQQISHNLQYQFIYGLYQETLDENIEIYFDDSQSDSLYTTNYFEYSENCLLFSKQSTKSEVKKPIQASDFYICVENSDEDYHEQWEIV